MKKVTAVFFVVCCFIVLGLFNIGCSKKSPTSSGPAPTQTPNYVKFSVTNNDTGTKTAISVQLIRNSDSSSYSQSCSITAGTSANVSVIIPATNLYDVYVNGYSGNYIKWCTFSATLGSTHAITIGSSGTLIDSHWVPCAGGGL